MILTVICLIILCWCLVGFAGTEVLFRKTRQLVDAVHAYNLHCIENHEHEKMISYFSINLPTLVDCACPWRWRYEALMPEDKLELVREYIGGKNED